MSLKRSPPNHRPLRAQEPMASRKTIHLTAAGTYVLTQARILHSVMINTGEAGATVTLKTDAGSEQTIATIAADKPDIGRVFDFKLPDGGLTVVIVGAPDVTVIYS